ncbi:MAG: hypothetical protein K2L95_01070 [Alphaproteobacteria bacterium]|nr:hypothetical protein [Alphaproteobacteria bacterium]
MNLKPVAVSLCVVLVACNSGGDGHSGAVGAPGKSAYEIWLGQGNVGTEQDFLDSLVSGDNNKGSGAVSPGDIGTGNNNGTGTGVSDGGWYPKNTREHVEHYAEDNYSLYSDFSAQNMVWAKHNGFMRYEWKQLGLSSANEQAITFVYNEKELKLGNYGVYSNAVQHGFQSEPRTYVYTGYIHNRDGIGANLYTPNDGTVFKGGALAYLHQSGKYDSERLIKGDATFTYSSTSPTFELAFDDYYTMTFKKASGGQSYDKYNIKISGQNNTGDARYNLPTGEFSDKDITTKFGYVSKGGLEEAFGTYSTRFYDTAYGKSGVITNDFYLDGAFGGTKQ